MSQKELFVHTNSINCTKHNRKHSPLVNVFKYEVQIFGEEALHLGMLCPEELSLFNTN